jgi:3-oxoacyl-[acyl-carrier protein] reductase
LDKNGKLDEESMNLKDKVSIVTGAAQGLGKAIAIGLAQRGSKIVVCDLNSELAKNVAEEIRSMGRKAFSQKVDVSKAPEVKAMVEHTLEEFGRIDILVNNAGICQVVSIDDMTEEDWDKVMDVNLKGVFLCSKAVMEIMKKQRSGKIINLGSIAGKVGGLTTGANHSVSKAGVMCFTKALARELAPFGITVNSVAPGIIETDMTRGITQGNFTNYVKSIPLGMIGKPEDVANAVAFLVSDEAGYITGEILDVNGGMLMD